MGEVTGFTAERMAEIEAAIIVDANVVGDDLILTLHDGSTINAGNVRGDTGAAGPVGTPPRVTSLPGSPSDGEEVLFVADAVKGILWPLKYNAGSASPYKWEACGPTELEVVQTGIQTTNNTSYVDSNSMRLQCPLAGDYDAWAQLRYANNTDQARGQMRLVTGTAIAENVANAGTDIVSLSSQASGGNADNEYLADVTRFTGVAANLYVKMQVKVGAGTGDFAARKLRIKPVRVG